MDRGKFCEELSGQTDAKKALQRLEDAGCERDDLEAWLFSISNLRKKARGIRRGLKPWRMLLGRPEYAYRRFAVRLHQLAEDIERINQSWVVRPVLFEPKVIGNLPARLRGWTRDLFRRFRSLPTVLHLYAYAIDQNLRLQRKRFAPPRLNFMTLLETRFLETVRDQAGSFHYAEVAALLEAAYRIVAPRDDYDHKLFSVQALAARCRRFSVKYPRPKSPRRLPYKILIRLG